MLMIYFYQFVYLPDIVGNTGGLAGPCIWTPVYKPEPNITRKMPKTPYNFESKKLEIHSHIYKCYISIKFSNIYFKCGFISPDIKGH